MKEPHLRLEMKKPSTRRWNPFLFTILCFVVENCLEKAPHFALLSGENVPWCTHLRTHRVNFFLRRMKMELVLCEHGTCPKLVRRPRPHLLLLRPFLPLIHPPPRRQQPGQQQRRGGTGAKTEFSWWTCSRRVSLLFVGPSEAHVMSRYVFSSHGGEWVSNRSVA